MIVEFIGLPGTGKTTISRGVAEALKKKRYDVKNPTDKINSLPVLLRVLVKIVFVGSVLFCHPKRSIQLFALVYKSKQTSFKDFISIYVNFLFIYRIIEYYKNDGAIILMDQGGIQAFWSLMYSSRVQDDAILKKTLFLFKPDYLVHVVSSKTSILSRLQTRQIVLSRLESDTGNIQDFSQLETHFEYFKAMLTDNLFTGICIIENSKRDNLEMNIETVVSSIISLLR